MRFLLCVAAVVWLSGAGVSAHADTLSTFTMTNQGGSALGTLTVDTTTGVVTGIDMSLTINSASEAFRGVPVSQAYSAYVNEYVATWDEGGNEFLFEAPASSLVGYAPADANKCKTNAVDCDFLANVYNGPISSADRVETLEGNLALASTTTTAPTPEPGSIALLGTGLLGVAGVIRRRADV